MIIADCYRCVGPHLQGELLEEVDMSVPAEGEGEYGGVVPVTLPGIVEDSLGVGDPMRGASVT